MIEPVMYVAIGFLVACMLIIGIIPSCTRAPSA